MEATVAFKNIDGKLKVIGTKENGQVNPTLISKTDAAYILTVINDDANTHMFYIDGINIHTKLLRAGENDIITIYSKTQGSYNYYDRLPSVGSQQENGTKAEPIGQFKVLKVAGNEW
ncbi:MAG TPA: hypothetical protein VF884_14375 [Nitrososphaeraceae archaeon]